jgi:hypothetical protein
MRPAAGGSIRSARLGHELLPDPLRATLLLCDALGQPGGELVAVNDAALVSGSKARSIRVLALGAASKVLENTILSAARQIPAKSNISGCRSKRNTIVSQPTIVSCIRRP